MRFSYLVSLGWCLFLLQACAVGKQAAPAVPVQTAPGPAVFADWLHWPLPGKAVTVYNAEHIAGRDALAAHAQSSASMMRLALQVQPQDLGQLQFAWKVPELMPQADLGVRESEDAPVRLVLAFEGDRSRFSMRDNLLSELSRSITGEPLPYATLMYVWCNTRPPGSVIHSTRTDRIRKLVVESGSANLNRWVDYERNIRADFEHVFGEPPGKLVGVAVMTDSDNTRSTARAWYGPVRLLTQ